jgi:mono/diheme cytochrome c family protein
MPRPTSIRPALVRAFAGVAALSVATLAGGAARAAQEDDVARGARLLQKGECARCHDTSGLPGATVAARERSCAGCHAWIHATAGDADAIERQSGRFPRWEQYVENVHSYLAVPSLAAAGARLDPAWVSRFLRAPYKIRPGFSESMIREPLSESDAGAIAAFLRAQARPFTGAAARAAATPVSTSAEDLAAGERLYATLQCGTCHAFGVARAATPGIPDAPDLAHVRARMRPADVAAFIADPTMGGLRRESRMPTYDLDPLQIGRLRDYLLQAPLAPRPPAAIAADLPLLDRRVTWDEVNTRVFSAVCAHCHSDGRLTNGDGGPGNTGGLGFRGAGLDLGSWRGVQRGARGSDGKRVSILVPGPGEAEAPLVARLRRRAHEHVAELAGKGLPPDPTGAVGMPLGLPPLDPARFQLVRSWVAQGAPGPALSGR